MNSYLSVICGTASKQRVERVVSRNQETGKVNQELAGNVEEDEEKVDSNDTQDGIDLGNRGLSLKVVEERVLGELRERKVCLVWVIVQFGDLDGKKRNE
jgi:hypothetical protein